MGGVNQDFAIFDALVEWVQADENGPGVGILLDLAIDRPCPLCGGTTFCPRGCPHRRERPIREYEYRREEGGWEQILVRGRECEACTIYGWCLSCFPDGRERRAAYRQGSTFLVDSVPLYSKPGLALSDPISISVARVRNELDSREVGQLSLTAEAA